MVNTIFFHFLTAFVSKSISPSCGNVILKVLPFPVGGKQFFVYWKPCSFANFENTTLFLLLQTDFLDSGKHILSLFANSLKRHQFARLVETFV